MTNLKLGVPDTSPYRTIGDWKDEISITPWSGVQVLDFGLKEEHLKRKLKFVEYDGAVVDGKKERLLAKLPDDPEAQTAFIETVSNKTPSEYTIDGAKAVARFDGEWLPAPVFRVRKTEHHGEKTILDRGPSAWARMRVAKLDPVDPLGNDTHRIQLALDTTLEKLSGSENTDYIKATERDSENGRLFRLSEDPDQIAWFLSGDQGQTWAADWIEDIYQEKLQRERSSRGSHDNDGRQFEDWAAYLTIVHLINEFGRVPTIRLANTISEHERQAAVEVDLVLDVGNSRICGLLVERFPTETSVELTRAFPLEMRDLGKPERQSIRPE